MYAIFGASLTETTGAWKVSLKGKEKKIDRAV